MSNAGVILGTAAYMRPEQARGRPVEQTGLYYAMWRQQMGERRMAAPALDVTV